MNTFKRLSHIAFLLLIFLLLSCQGSTSREWIVNNTSSTTIQVSCVLVLGTDSIYESIETGETRIITITSEPRANSDPQQAYDVFYSFLVTNVNGDTIPKDFTNNDNWDIYVEHTKHRPDHFDITYTLIVKDEDFESSLAVDH